MSSSQLIRWSGLAAVGAGILLPAAWMLTFTARSETNSLGLIGLWLLFIAHPLIMFALMGIYALQHEEFGVTGFIGFLLASIAETYHATVFQIALAWLVMQPRVITIPMSHNPKHIRENFDAADIELSEEEMKELNKPS